MIFTILAFKKYGAGTRGLAAVATVVAYSYAYWSKYEHKHRRCRASSSQHLNSSSEVQLFIHEDKSKYRG
jgi:hypothetical protein